MHSLVLHRARSVALHISCSLTGAPSFANAPLILTQQVDAQPGADTSPAALLAQGRCAACSRGAQPNMHVGVETWTRTYRTARSHATNSAPSAMPGPLPQYLVLDGRRECALRGAQPNVHENVAFFSRCAAFSPRLRCCCCCCCSFCCSFCCCCLHPPLHITLLFFFWRRAHSINQILFSVSPLSLCVACGRQHACRTCARSSRRTDTSG